MNLYNQQGRSIHLELPAWEKLLLAARRWGWQPAGTVRPPLALDVDLPRHAAPWPADTYELPWGQTMLRQDALSLANTLHSLIRAGSAFRTIPIREAQQLVAFCNIGPFLICAEAADDARSTPWPARRTRPLGQPAGCLTAASHAASCQFLAW